MYLTTPNKPDHLLLKKRRKFSLPEVTINLGVHNFSSTKDWRKAGLTFDERYELFQDYVRENYLFEFNDERRKRELDVLAKEFTKYSGVTLSVSTAGNGISFTLNFETRTYLVKLGLNSGRKLYVLKDWETQRYGHTIKFIGESRIDGCPIFKISCVIKPDEVAYYDHNSQLPVYYRNVSTTDIFDGIEICGTVIRYGEFNVELIQNLEDKISSINQYDPIHFAPYISMSSTDVKIDSSFASKWSNPVMESNK